MSAINAAADDGAVSDGALFDSAAFDSAVFRQVINNFASGVVVITTVHDGVAHGATVSAISSLSLDPPMLLVCLNSRSATQEAVRSSGQFAVNILADMITTHTEHAKSTQRAGTLRYGGGL
jgi:flavin reductase (DIM6/NTAB) family NADH-FMN oxidoreductase RutF